MAKDRKNAEERAGADSLETRRKMVQLAVRRALFVIGLLVPFAILTSVVLHALPDDVETTFRGIFWLFVLSVALLLRTILCVRTNRKSPSG